MRKVICVMLLGVFGAGLCSLAQDVTVADIQFLNTESPPDVLPRVRGDWEPAYPALLKDAAVYGYVISVVRIDKTGVPAFVSAKATNRIFLSGVDAVQERLQFAPAKKNGASVATAARVVTIFNPRGASAKGDDANPRLLNVVAVTIPGDKVTEIVGRDVIWCQCEIDASGQLIGLGLEPAYRFAEAFYPEIEAALSQWKFAPARVGGKPVTARAVLPVLLQKLADARENDAAAVNVQLPKAISRTAPRFPFNLVRGSIGGEVQVSFVIGKDGTVRDVVATRATHPDFAMAAVDAVRQWKYTPRLENGVPVEMSLNFPITFSIGEQEGSDTGTIKSDAKTQAALPPQFRYDIGPRAAVRDTPVYPYALLREKIKGSAQAAVAIDEYGKITQIDIASASHPEFGNALAAALEGFRYDPALRDGRQTATGVFYAHEFTPKADHADLSAETFRLLSMEEKSPGKIIDEKQLDAPITPITATAPVFPLVLKNRGIKKGSAVIEFLVDTNGWVYLPRVVSATEPEFGYAAVQNLARRCYTVPKSKGAPVVARLRATVAFDFEAITDEKNDALPYSVEATRIR